MILDFTKSPVALLSIKVFSLKNIISGHCHYKTFIFQIIHLFSSYLDKDSEGLKGVNLLITMATVPAKTNSYMHVWSVIFLK